MPKNQISMPMTVQEGGMTWHLFDVNYKDKDGHLYSFYIYALDRYHANLLLTDIKEGAYLADDIAGITPN